jgi:hypothetical protein
MNQTAIVAIWPPNTPALQETRVNNRKTALILAVAFGALAYSLYAAKAQNTVTLTLGQNAYVLQQDTGFPMGYPSRADGTGPTGGRQAGISADLTLGPLHLACENAMLEASQIADVVQAGRLFCADPEALVTMEGLHDQISTAGNWNEFTDHTISPRRAVEFGMTPKAAFDYLDSQPMRGSVMRVPLYSWRSDAGLLFELNAARHTDLHNALGYELVFSWGAGCLLSAATTQSKSGKDLPDEARATQMQAQLPDICGAEVKALTTP